MFSKDTTDRRFLSKSDTLFSLLFAAVSERMTWPQFLIGNGKHYRFQS